MKVEMPRAAAWAPWGDGSRGWLLRRDEVAVEWLARSAHADGSPVIVQASSHASDHQRGDGPIARLARVGQVATYKSSVGHGATFVATPDIQLMAAAMGTANGHALAVTELPTSPMQGWAMATGALNLESDEVTEDTRTDGQKDMLEHFISRLYNGWSHQQVGRQASAYYLPRLAESGMSYPIFLGSVLAAAPRYLDSRADIADMMKALPPVWKTEAEELVRYDKFTHR